MNKIILIEFNELSPRLLDKWMGEGKLANFKKFYDASSVYVSKPDVEELQYLEPWIQWYSMHTGLAYDQHQVFHLTDGPKAGHLDIWSLLREQGHTVASFASMNNKGFGGEGDLFLPDPWCTSEAPFPADMGIYQHFISSNVQEYTNENRAFTKSDYARFVSFMTRHGMSVATISKILKQLMSEKFGKGNSWKRVALLDRIQMDLFKYMYRHNDYQFTTFFANSTAHLQHAYWRFMEPEAFDIKPDSGDLENYKDAVFFGYDNMDNLLGEFMELAEQEGASLILASALSQQPFLRAESEGGQNFYRPKDIDALLANIDIRPTDVQPTMTHQYMLRFADRTERDRARQKIHSWSFGGGGHF